MNHSIPEWWVERNGWDFWRDYDAGYWEPDTRELLHQFIRPGTTYVDIGAWIGPTVLWGAAIASRVIAVEPDPIALRHLARNTAECGNVQIAAGAISPHGGPVNIVPHKEGYGSSMTRLQGDHLPRPNTWDESLAETVHSWTVPQLFDDFHIENCSLVKIDIEGGESEILPHAAPYLASLRIPLVFSPHPQWMGPIDEAWFDGYTHVSGDWTDNKPMLALP